MSHQLQPVEGSLPLHSNIPSLLGSCIRFPLTAETSGMSLFMFSDDAEVQRQKVVPVLIRPGCSRPPAHSRHPSCVCPCIGPSKPSSPGTAGIFSPGTTLNSDLASVFRAERRSRWGRKPPRRERNKGVHIYVLISLIISALIGS